VWGAKDRVVRFRVGASTISTVDVRTLRMRVVRDGKLVRTIPVTTGKAGFLTRGGIKVISEKYSMKVMDAATINIRPGDPEYYRLEVPFALRVTWSGESSHGAPWSVRNQGRANVSHGCVGMSMADAKWLFAATRIGDVVSVVGHAALWSRTTAGPTGTSRGTSGRRAARSPEQWPALGRTDTSARRNDTSHSRVRMSLISVQPAAGRHAQRTESRR
jgi:hypothetical protein